MTNNIPIFFIIFLLFAIIVLVIYIIINCKKYTSSGESSGSCPSIPSYFSDDCSSCKYTKCNIMQTSSNLNLILYCVIQNKYLTLTNKTPTTIAITLSTYDSDSLTFLGVCNTSNEPMCNPSFWKYGESKNFTKISDKYYSCGHQSDPNSIILDFS